MITTNTPAERPTKTKTLTTSDLPADEKRPAPGPPGKRRIIQTGDFDLRGKYKGAAPEPAKEKRDEK